MSFSLDSSIKFNKLVRQFYENGNNLTNKPMNLDFQFFFFFYQYLINFYGAINLSDEAISANESYCSSQHIECKYHETCNERIS